MSEAVHLHINRHNSKSFVLILIIPAIVFTILAILLFTKILNNGEVAGVSTEQESSQP